MEKCIVTFSAGPFLTIGCHVAFVVGKTLTIRQSEILYFSYEIRSFNPYALKSCLYDQGDSSVCSEADRVIYTDKGTIDERLLSGC